MPSHCGCSTGWKERKRALPPWQPGILPAIEPGATPGVQSERRGKHRIYFLRRTVRDWYSDILPRIDRALSRRMPIRRSRTNKSLTPHSMERCGSREKPCFQRVPLLMTVIGACVCLALFCSCAMAPIWFSHDSIPPKLPAAVSFNKGAGRGDPLYLTLRLESGEELLFMVDTGAAFTLLDKSLEPGLGKRYGTARIKWLGGKSTAVVYRAPKLYLGDTQLLTGARILTDDLRMIPLAGQPLQGILGTDCLRHYCIQLDFAARKIRFLDPDLPKSEDLGRAFPLSIFFSTVSAHENLVGVKGAKSDIDTGCNFDGTLSSGLFQQELRQQNLVLTNGMARLAESFWAGETYTNLNVVEYGVGFTTLSVCGFWPGTWSLSIFLNAQCISSARASGLSQMSPAPRTRWDPLRDGGKRRACPRPVTTRNLWRHAWCLRQTCARASQMHFPKSFRGTHPVSSRWVRRRQNCVWFKCRMAITG